MKTNSKLSAFLILLIAICLSSYFVDNLALISKSKNKQNNKKKGAESFTNGVENFTAQDLTGQKFSEPDPLSVPKQSTNTQGGK
jgi:hypothetical protein